MKFSFAGWEKVTLLDYPGEVASTLFTSACNMRCPFCHNPELVLPQHLENKTESHDWQDIREYLHKRRHVLGGVCITGGEPLLHPEIEEIVSEIKDIGLKVKLDTNGSLPARLKLLDLDYIAMDLKTSFGKLEQVGYRGDLQSLEASLKESISYIIASGISHEFRTTVMLDLVNLDDIQALCQHLTGAEVYYLAKFRAGKTLDPLLSANNIPADELLRQMQELVASQGIKCLLRACYT